MIQFFYLFYFFFAILHYCIRCTFSRALRREELSFARHDASVRLTLLHFSKSLSLSLVSSLVIKSQTLLGACSQSPRLTLFFAAITLTCSAAVAAGGQPSPFQKTPAKWQLSGGNVSLSTKLTNYTNERSVFVLQALIFGLEGFQLLVCGGWVTRTHNRNTNTLRDTGHGGFWKKKKIQKIINHVVSVRTLLQ